MDFINRMRKIRVTNSNISESVNPVSSAQQVQSSHKSAKSSVTTMDNVVYSTPSPDLNKKGLKKIATSRKKHEPPDTGHKNVVCTNSCTSVSSTGSYCNESCPSPTELNSSTSGGGGGGRITPNSQVSQRDSGVESNANNHKKNVSPQTSTGSVLSEAHRQAHVEQFERAIKARQEARKPSERRNGNERRETAKERFRRATEDIHHRDINDIFTKLQEEHNQETLINSSPEPPITIRRPALDHDDRKSTNPTRKRVSKRRGNTKRTSIKRRNSYPSLESIGSYQSTESCDQSYSDDAFADDESGVSDKDPGCGSDLSTTDVGNKYRRNSGYKKRERPCVRSKKKNTETHQDSEDEKKPTIPDKILTVKKDIPQTKIPEKKLDQHKNQDHPTTGKKIHQQEQKQGKQQHSGSKVPALINTGLKTPRLNKYDASKDLVQPTSRRVNGVTLRDLYSLRAVLSDSDNGTVFSGRRRIDNAAVAIKRIMKSKVKRWHNIKDKPVPMEIALLRRVNEQRHPGVNNLLEWFECADCFLLVMARPTPVLDLFDYVSERKRLDEDTSKSILVQIVEALNHCHHRGVLHRDVKLENVLIKTDTLTTTIIDFGCGTNIHNNLYKDFAGTPQYYPPEYYMTKQYYGLHATVWSLGITLYAMLCGRLPFASAHEIVHLEPSWHGSFCRKISGSAKDLVEQMLKKQPKKRLHMSEILKHRWLKNIKYNTLTGEVTILPEKSTNGTQPSSNDIRKVGKASSSVNVVL